jgi:Na+-translocating ferredoxin:NAD+ oxidoreductase RnfD subunit
MAGEPSLSAATAPVLPPESARRVPAPSTVVTLGGRAIPVFLPSLRDPRLHVAAVIISIHVLGQVGLGFRVSVPQILAAILTCAVLEVALAFRQSGALVWPASAMLTGSGVALILRVVGTPAGDPWTTFAVPLYAAVAGLSLLSKYVIQYRGSHIFNPSNLGLVAVFVLLGASRVEPLDFWWGPLDGWMLLAYAVILVGGLLITRRLRLLALAAAFWLTFASGTGVLAVSGHCMTANWAFAPVCDWQYWRVIMASPEVLIFLFFMITDPKTIPAGRVGRVAFGVLVGVACTLLLAPQSDEFGAKVGLLAGLVVICAARPFIERFLPAPRSTSDDLTAFARRLAGGGAVTRPARGVRPARVAAAAVGLAVVGGGIVAAGAPARAAVPPSSVAELDRLPAVVDPTTLPPIHVDQDVVDFDDQLAGPGMADVVVTLGQNLRIERQALLTRDAGLLTAVDHGDRLTEMNARLEAARVSGTTSVERYSFDSFDASLLVPFGQQTGLSLGLAARGTLVRETYDASGALQGQTSEPFQLTFAMRRATGSRWLNVGVLPPSG